MDVNCAILQDFGSCRQLSSYTTMLHNLRMSSLLGARIAGYLVSRELGRGGMGVVYQARSEADGSEVALKILPLALAQTGELAERFRREGRLAAAVAHPNLVRNGLNCNISTLLLI